MDKKKPSYEDLENKVRSLENQVELFDKLMEISPFYIFFKDKDIKPVKLSQNYEKILGMPIEKLIGKSMDELFPSDLAKSMVEDDKKALNAGKVIEVVEDFNNRSYYTIKFPIKLKDNSTVLGGFTIDETEKIRSQRALKELNDTKDNLFSIIAHDLRSPFNSILGFSEILSAKVKNGDYEKVARYCDNINSSAKNTLGLLENLMDWAKTQSGKIEFEPQNILLSSIYYEVEEILEADAKRKGVSLNYVESNKLEVFADVDLLRTIFRNLISNAIKYSNKGGKIEIVAVNELNQIEVSVSDDGIGMSKEIQSKLFKFEERLKTIGTDNEKGSGLGLLICKKFIEKHNGIISIVSKEGKGSEVKFTIPSNKIN